ncbi:retropepsin-like aspartic protease [Paenibacillus rhizoplanae]
MQWQEVRSIYPNQYVLLEILDSHTRHNIEYIDDVALIRAIQDPDEATQLLLNCKKIIILFIIPGKKISQSSLEIILYIGVDKMQIEFMFGLLQTSMTINYRGRSLIVNDLVIDTGAAHSLLSSDIVSELGIKFENGDRLVRSFGIGGDEYTFQKTVDEVRIGELIMKDVPIDFGVFFMKVLITSTVLLDWMF